jgi:NhaC family Na+:H+ antiporter
MLNTVWLILLAMIFGGLMEATGMLATLANTILKFVKGTATLVGSTLATSIILNMTASDQYLSIVVTGKMFTSAYDKFNLHPKNLSRAVEDGATVTSVLVPWNSGGAYFSSILGVPTLTYLPYCFFNILSPLCSLFLATMGWTMAQKFEEAKNSANT